MMSVTRETGKMNPLTKSIMRLVAMVKVVELNKQYYFTEPTEYVANPVVIWLACVQGNIFLCGLLSLTLPWRIKHKVSRKSQNLLNPSSILNRKHSSNYPEPEVDKAKVSAGIIRRRGTIKSMDRAQ